MEGRPIDGCRAMDEKQSCTPSRMRLPHVNHTLWGKLALGLASTRWSSPAGCDVRLWDPLNLRETPKARRNHPMVPLKEHA